MIVQRDTKRIFFISELTPISGNKIKALSMKKITYSVETKIQGYWC